MTETAIIYRLNIIIALLCAILGILVWPILMSALYLAGILLFLVIGAAVVGALAQPYR